MILVTAEQMQQMDRKTIQEFGIPGRILMENAGRSAVDYLVKEFSLTPDKGVAILAGRGNNGGDGFVMARYLMEMGVKVSIFLLSSREKVGGDARDNMILAEKLLDKHPESVMVQITDAQTFAQHKSSIIHSDIFVDAIFGTGLNTDVRGFFRDLIQGVNDSGKPVFSVDIPSGINADTGKICGVAIQAAATASFGSAKVGQILYPGSNHTGRLEIVDIGIPEHILAAEHPYFFLVEQKDIGPFFPCRPLNSHKGSFGHLLVIAGSPGKTGAAALCSNAAMASGTGLVTLGVPEGINPAIESQVIEPMTFPLPQTRTGSLDQEGLKTIEKLAADKEAMALGPGLGTDKETRALVKEIVKTISTPMVIDADGLNCLADDPGILKKRRFPTIITPHPGEMARLIGKTSAEIQADRSGIGRAFAKDFQVILVLKGAQTLICCPDGRVFISATGNPGMASGGMGDVLTGMIAGFAAQGIPFEKAAIAGVYIHGLTGDYLAKKINSFGFLASDMVRAIPKTIGQYLK